MFIGGITSYVTFPKLYLKNGQLNHEDLETIPLSLKLKLAVMQWILLILVTAMFVLYFIGEAEFFN